MRFDYRDMKPYRDYQRDRMLVFRLGVVRVALIVGFFLFVAVFWYLQIAHGREYRRQAEENRLRRRVERPVRGVIRDVVGRIVVTNRPSFNVYLDRQRSGDPAHDVLRLAELVDVAPEALLEQLEKARHVPKFLPIPLEHDVGLETVARLGALRPELPSVDVVVDARRFYPLGSAAAHVIGYLSEVTVDELRRREDLLPGDRVGRTGVEAAFDVDLRGRPGLVLEEVNARGRPLQTVTTVRPTHHGRPMRLTLDGAMQQDVERAFGGRGGAAVFIDPRNGAIRALYSGPSFDPNIFSSRMSRETWLSLLEDPERPLQNRAVAGTYSPGSTFKIVMAVAALESGVLAPGERIFCGGAARFHGQLRRCHRRSGHGSVGLEEAITRSCNVFFYTVGQRLGIERIADWASRLGLGTRTGAPFDGEASGLVPTAEWKRRQRGEPWYPGETISVAIGQGPVMVTPLQMAVVAAAIANGGYRVSPFLRERQSGPRAPQRLSISDSSLQRVRRGMIDVVESDRGTARRARVRGRTLAGKTGTAQVVALSAARDPGDHAWFIGFGPAEAPELAWAVIVENAGHGGAEAAPVVQSVLKSYFERTAGRSETLIVKRGGQ
ncbi:MAG: penicillin-binding protein 2 [Acidobacteriota bacterium]|nr:penicillin-binding protein 2 [Acidobacteriota bacterium]